MKVTKPCIRLVVLWWGCQLKYIYECVCVCSPMTYTTNIGNRYSKEYSIHIDDKTAIPIAIHTVAPLLDIWPYGNQIPIDDNSEKCLIYEP